MVLHTQSWGRSSGSPVVSLHGVTGHSGRFADLAGHLGGHRVIGIDLRGHGRSTYLPPWGVEQHLADLLETADALGIGTATWLGHSFGGRLVTELAARHPGRVERAVLLDPVLHIDPETAGERSELLRDDVSFASADEAIDSRLADGTLFTTPRATLEREAEAHLEQSPDGRFRWRFSAPAVIVAWSIMASPAPPWPECETLVVLGERSWIRTPVPKLATIRQVVVPGGHSVLWDDFEATADAVAGFLGNR